MHHAQFLGRRRRSSGLKVMEVLQGRWSVIVIADANGRMRVDDIAKKKRIWLILVHHAYKNDPQKVARYQEYVRCCIQSRDGPAYFRLGHHAIHAVCPGAAIFKSFRRSSEGWESLSTNVSMSSNPNLLPVYMNRNETRIVIFKITMLLHQRACESVVGSLDRFCSRYVKY